jgi:hypothetical protein
MSTVQSTDLVFAPDVPAFLERHGATGEFQVFCEIVWASFPERTGSKVWLVADPDEEGRCWVDLCISLPLPCDAETIHAQRVRYSEEVARRLPSRDTFSFSLSLTFAADSIP